MDIDEIRTLALSSSHSILEEMLSSVLNQIDEAHKKGERKGTFMDDGWRFGDEEFMEDAWYEMQEQFVSRMAEEGIEVDDYSEEGVEVYWSDDGKRFAGEFNKLFEQELNSWSSFIEDLIREAATDGKNQVSWEGDVYENVKFREMLKKKFSDSGFKFAGLNPPGFDLYTGRISETDTGLIVESFAEFEISW
jgi:hypothetical protein